LARNVHSTQARHVQRAYARCSINVSWLRQLPPDALPSKDWPSPHHLSARTRHFGTSSKLNPNAKPFVPTLTRSASDVLEASSQSFKFQAAASSIPHPDKAHKGGEDAYFIAPQSNVIGIADGVGGWEAHGIDSALYSRSLMQFASEAADSEANPLEILKFAHSRAAGIAGSSTACIISLVGTQLEAANLGDSGFMLIRNGHLLFKTKEQQHYFNCPLQIGNSRDMPDHSDKLRIAVEVGDILVVATDGLFDNVFPDRIVQLVTEGLHLDPPALAQILAAEATRIGLDSTAETPFAEGARKSGQYWRGGKLDDVTVIVARIGIVEATTESPVGTTSSSHGPKLRERN